MRLDPRIRAAIYIVFGVLFVTGVAWLLVDGRWTGGVGDAWQAASTYLLMVHGGAAMMFLLLLGAVVSSHVPIVWRSRMNRVSGVFMLMSNGLLIFTAFGLYYFGSETLRHWTSDLHVAVGLGMQALLVVHVLLGRRRIRSARRNASQTGSEPNDPMMPRRAHAVSLTRNRGEGR